MLKFYKIPDWWLLYSLLFLISYWISFYPWPILSFWAHFYTVAYFIPSPLLPASVHLPFSPLPRLPIFTEAPALPPQLAFSFSPISSSWLNKHAGLRTICYWWALMCEKHMQRTRQTWQTKNMKLFWRFYEMKFDLKDSELYTGAHTDTHTYPPHSILCWPEHIHIHTWEE